MACEKPNVMTRMRMKTLTGKQSLKFRGSAQKYFDKQKHCPEGKVPENVILIPCQQCAGCRLDKSKEWAIRILYEAKKHETSTFVTLTYDEKHKKDSLDGPRITTFIKDLRARLDYKVKTKVLEKEQAKIKFFAIGEYGEKKGRPHYHAILFGGPFGRQNGNDEEPSRSGGAQWTHPDIEAVWPEGRHRISEVNFESAAYVARYSLKKITGDRAASHYGDKTPEFLRLSKGVGKAWFEDWYQDIYPQGTVILPERPEILAPKYYDRLLEKIDPALLEETKKEREKNRKKHETIKDYLEHSERRNREGRVRGLKIKSTLKREL